jgi:multicomponent Na+:H+ antiporter subunit A
VDRDRATFYHRERDEETRRLMSSGTLHVLIVLSPFLLFPVAGWLGARGAPRASLLAVVPAALAAYFAVQLAGVAARGPLLVSVPWAPSLGLSISFYYDGLGLFFATLIAAIGALIVVYGASYLDGHPLAGRFQLALFGFMGSMLGLVLSDNLIALFVFWELTGFTSYFLIGFDHERPRARSAAMQALLVTGAGGLALLAAAVLLWQVGGDPSLSVLRGSGASFARHGMYLPITVLVLLAAFTKSAQFPFHFWLPNAMEAPTPVSGYLHSATMVKAGIYLVARMTPLLGGTPFWTGVTVAVGAATMLGAAYRSLLETDLKRILAYTTISSLGAMMLLLGVGTRLAIVASLVYLLGHACYKGALVLVAGALDHQTGTRDVRTLSGLRHRMPLTATAGVLAAVSMAGVPPLLGFVAKEQLYAGVLGFGAAGVLMPVVLDVAVAASAMLGAAGLNVGAAPFLGSAPSLADAREAAPALWLAPLILAGVSVVVGVAPALLSLPLTLAASAATGESTPVRLALWHGLTPEIALSGVTLALTLLLYQYRATVRQRAWAGSLHAERLYTATLAGLDRLSGRVAPALQSGSLRSYVRVIVVTAVVLLLAAYARSGGLPALQSPTPVRPHEVGVGLMIMLAAIAAARARSTMTAVLSLGTVGYGVALLYILYGAPDLAATQFAVETLTVVLFVLVFYRLRGFDDGASRLSRTRDAIISGAAGASIALLVLVTGASGITSRLADYFVEAAPVLAHGRNVVNVILVDFRGFDTMGEITVLVTVAIGVRALLRIGRERSS